MAIYKKYINKKGKVTYYIRSFDGYDENGKQIEHSMKWCPPETMSEKNIEKELQRQMTLFDDKIHFSVRFTGTHITIENAKKIAKFLNIKENRLFDIHQSQKGLSSKTILNHHRLISCILAQAVRDRIIAVNVASNVYMKAPKVERKEAIFLNDNQAIDVINALKNEPIKWRTALGLLIYSGMRRGELMGLEWKDIDFENGTIDIYRTSQYISGLGLITKSTKTVSSQRVIKLPVEAMDLLNEYKEYWTDNKNKLEGYWKDRIIIKYVNGEQELVENDRLFNQDDGSPMNPDSLTDWTSKFVRKNKLPYFSPHSLRHTNASLLIANGVNISTVSKRLGHSSINTTTKIYTHAIQSADAKAADVLDNLLNSAKE